MKDKLETRAVMKVIAAMYPDAHIELKFHNLFELLIVVALSAQTTDKAVNKVSPALFAAYPTPKALAHADINDVMHKLRTIGLYKNKAKNIIKCSQMLIDKFHGQVPNNKKDLMSLPGVGQKTANVVLSVGFNIPELAVDTHVERVAKRLDLVPQNATVNEVEEILKSKIPKSDWTKAHHQLIFFGRYFCKAKNPNCLECPLLAACPFGLNYLAEKG